MAQEIVSAATTDSQQKELHQQVHPIVVVGGLPQGHSREDWLANTFAKTYLGNVAYIVDTLGSPTVIAGVTGRQEANTDMRWARGQNFQRWNDSTFDDSLPFSIDYRFFTANLDLLSFPRNAVVPLGPHFTLARDNENALVQTVEKLDEFHRIMPHKILGNGGKYKGVETGSLIFAALPHDSSEIHVQILREGAFPNRTVVPVLTPREVGLTESKRVVDDIDQFIAHPLSVTGDNEYVVVIDDRYQRQLQAHNVVLPENTTDGKRITYREANHSYTSANYVLNTVASPTGDIFIEPELKDILIRSGDWDRLDHSKIHVMPYNIPTDERIQGGAGCKIVILAA